MEFCDLVIKVNVNEENKVQFRNRNTRTIEHIKNINKLISTILQQNFKIQIMKGIELGKYYLMISASQELLEEECTN